MGAWEITAELAHFVRDSMEPRGPPLVHGPLLVLGPEQELRYFWC